MALDLKKVRARLDALKLPATKTEKRRLKREEEDFDLEEHIYFSAHGEHSIRFVNKLRAQQGL